MESTRVELEKLTTSPKYKEFKAAKERRRRQERELAGSRSFTGRARSNDCSVLNDARITVRDLQNTMINTSVSSNTTATFRGRFAEYYKLENDDENEEEANGRRL